jgi:hypothetical protein
MIDLFQLWEKLIGAVNMPQGGAVKPHRNFVHWVNDISISLYEEKFIDWEKSQKNIDDLSRPFLKSVSLQVQDVPGSNYGLIKFPADYGHYSSTRYFAKGNGDDMKGVPLPGLEFCDCNGKKIDVTGDCPSFLDEEIFDILKQEQIQKENEQGKENAELFKEFPVDKISNSRWGAALEHRFLGPKKTRPLVTDANVNIDGQTSGGLKVAPAGIGIVILDYLKKPAPAKFGYKVLPGDELTGEGDDLVYDPTSSVALEWSELVINEFVHRLEEKYGKFVRDQFTYQTSANDVKTKV